MIGLLLALINFLKPCETVAFNDTKTWVNTTTVEKTIRKEVMTEKKVTQEVAETISIPVIETRDFTEVRNQTVVRNVSEVQNVTTIVKEPRNVTVTRKREVQNSTVIFVNKTVNITKFVPVVEKIEVKQSFTSEHPAAVMILLDGSTSIIEKTTGWPQQIKGDGMGSWRTEKKAAIELITALQQNLTKLQVGMVQFSGYPGNTKPQDSLLGGEWAKQYENCTTWGTNGMEAVQFGGAPTQACPGQYALYSVNMSHNLSDVQLKIDEQPLMRGGTDFGSPLALCDMHMSKVVNNETKKFCVLVSDGAPNEKLDETKSAVMKQFCDEQNLTGVCYKEEEDWMTGTVIKTEVSCCSPRNVMYRIKSLGYIIFGIIVQEQGPMGQFFAKANQDKMRLYASCEKTGTYGLRSEYNPAELFKQETTLQNGTNVTHPSNYDADGECLYYANAKSMDDLVNKLGTISNALVETVGITTTKEITRNIEKTVLQPQQVSETVMENITVEYSHVEEKLFTVQQTMEKNVTVQKTITEQVSEIVTKNVTVQRKVPTGKMKNITVLKNVTEIQEVPTGVFETMKENVTTNETVTTGGWGTVCVGNPLWLALIILFCAPLACYIFWLPISIFLAKMLLKNKGPIHGRKRRMIAKKAYDVLNEAVQQGTAGDPHTTVFVQSNIPCATSDQTKVYTLDAHILDNPKDPKSGHAATVDEMKSNLFKKSGVPPAEQHLVYKGTELKDGTAISDYDLQNNSTVFLNPKPVPVKIKARMKNSKKPKVIELDADQSYSVDQVKQALKDAEGLPISHQQLWCNGNELEGMVSLSDLPEGAELSLNPITGKFPVMLVNPNGETKPLEVKATHKIGNVKKRLQKEGSLEHGDLSDQHLVCNGTEMGDKQCSMDHDIPENGLIFLNPKKFRMPVKKPNGEMFELPVDPSYTVDKVKQELVKAGAVPEGMSPDKLNLFMQGPTEPHRNANAGANGGDAPSYQGLNMINMDGEKTLYELGIGDKIEGHTLTPQGSPLLLNPIFVKDKIGQILPVNVTPNMPVEELKKQINEATGIPTPEMSVIYEPHSIVDGLPEGQPLSAFGVTADGNTMLSLNPNRMKFNVQCGNGDVVPVNVDMTDSIDKLKLNVMDKAGIPMEGQQIFFNGKELTEGDMIDNDITEGATLLVNPVMIQPPSGKPFPVNVSFQGTLDDVKAEISKNMPSGDVNQNNLVFQGQNIAPGKTLAQYGVGDTSKTVSNTPNMERTLLLDPKPVQLNIIGPGGATYPLTVDKSWSIDQIKQEITQKSAIAVGDQHLKVIDGDETRELQDGTTLLDNGIVEDMSLYLNPQDIRCFVKLPTGKAIVANLSTADTPQGVRKKVEALAKAGSLQATTLVYGVEEMAEDKCLADYDVVPDSTIRMTMGTAQGTDGKKWDVETNVYVRGGNQGALKIDYGASGIAPPSAKVGDQSGLAKLKGAADVIKVKNMMEKMQAQLAEEQAETDDSLQETASVKQTRLAAAKQRKISMMRHAAMEAEGKTAVSEEERRMMLEHDPEMQQHDLNYKYTLCLMKCCPCLRPETEEEIEAKNAKKLGAAKKPVAAAH
jgi:hypothetical protein